MEEFGEGVQVGRGVRGEVGGEGGDVGGAGAVDVEEEGGVGGGGGEGGEVEELLGPVGGVGGGGVGGVEEVGEGGVVGGWGWVVVCWGRWVGGCVGSGCWERGRVPECGGEGEVDFLESAVGDVVDGLGDSWWKWGCEGGFVSFEAA